MGLRYVTWPETKHHFRKFTHQEMHWYADNEIHLSSKCNIRENPIFPFQQSDLATQITLVSLDCNEFRLVSEIGQIMQLPKGLSYHRRILLRK